VRGRQRPYYQGTREGNKKRQGETQGSTKIGAFSSFTLYFFFLFLTHLGFFIAP
jgi:hypothetical protein